MSMTQGGLFFIGGLALLATVGGLFIRFPREDKWTGPLIAFLGAALWTMFGISSFDVITRDSAVAQASEPIMPLVIIGFGLAFLTALFALASIFTKVGEEAEDASGVLLND